MKKTGVSVEKNFVNSKMCSSDADETGKMSSSLSSDACRDYSKTTKEGLIEILEFTHFCRFYSFNVKGSNSREKRLIIKIQVVVALRVVPGNSKTAK